MKKNNTMLHKEYEITNGTRISISIFYTTPYRETIKLHTFHKRRRVWMAVGRDIKTKASWKRTRQIERFCKAAGIKCKVSHLPITPA